MNKKMEDVQKYFLKYVHIGGPDETPVFFFVDETEGKEVDLTTSVVAAVENYWGLQEGKKLQPSIDIVGINLAFGQKTICQITFDFEKYIEDNT